MISFGNGENYFDSCGRRTQQKGKHGDVVGFYISRWSTNINGKNINVLADVVNDLITEVNSLRARVVELEGQEDVI